MKSWPPARPARTAVAEDLERALAPGASFRPEEWRAALAEIYLPVNLPS